MRGFGMRAYIRLMKQTKKSFSQILPHEAAYNVLSGLKRFAGKFS